MFYPFQSRWRTCCWNSTNSLGGNDRRLKSTSSGSVLISEQSGTKISALLTSPDLSGCLHPICDISEEGASHSRRGANFSGTCIICGNIYRGETGFEAHTRVLQHGEDFRRKYVNNSMAAHISDHHLEHQGDSTASVFSVSKTGPSPLLRQVREAATSFRFVQLF